MQTNLHRCLTLALLLVTFTCGGIARAGTQEESSTIHGASPYLSW